MSEMFLDEIQKKARRIDNVSFNKLENTDIGDISYENYNGVNMDLNNEHGGDVLRIRKLQKVGKEVIRKADGKTIKKVIYLYSGYIYNTKDENDREITDLDKEAYPVCFETSIKLEDIAKKDIKKEKSSFLKFLSEKENFERKQTVNYIGYFYLKFIKDGDGIIEECWYSKGKISSSPTIQRKI